MELVALWVEVDVDDDMVGDVEFTADVVDGAAAASSEASNVSVGFPWFAEESELKVCFMTCWLTLAIPSACVAQPILN